MKSWLSYWDAPNKSYVGDRHRQAHYDVLLDGVRPYLPAGPATVVLDWGCGDALAAARMVEVCGTLLLYDAAASTRERLHRRYAGRPAIQVLDNSALAGLPVDSIDLVIVNSVIQYLAEREFDQALTLFRRVLKPGGALLLGDVITPGTPTSTHVATFLRFAVSRGFLLSALGGLASTFLSPYRRLQRDVGLSSYAAPRMLEKLAQHGFAAATLARNIAVSPHRSSYLARKPDPTRGAPPARDRASARSEWGAR
jgi:SAM-dependent methyltransferase